MTRSTAMRFIFSLVSLLALSLTAAGPARAEGFALNRYLPAPLPSDGFSVSRPSDLGHLRWAANLQVDYANDPLVLELRPGDADSEKAAIVHHQLVPHVGLALGLLDRVVVGADLAVNAVQRGERFIDPLTGQRVRLSDGAGLGDANFLLRVRMLGDAEALFALAVQARLTLPLAQAANSDQRFSGEHGVSVLPELAAELRLGLLRITGNLGTRIRSTSELPRAPIESGLRYALGVTLRVLPPLELMAEVHGETGFDHFFKRATTANELLGGAKVWCGNSGFVLGAAAGPGLSRAVGTPDYRLIGMLGYETPPARPLPAAPRDSDFDQIPDDQDACPTQPEDRDRFEDIDGCPEPDNDQDGVLDVEDACPREAEDRDGFEDKNGCPDPDNDQDGILDAADKCPQQAEDMDRFQDDDGCPDPDNDGDTVPDTTDKCPNDPGAPADQGCPRARVEQGQIRILDRVEFATGKDTILASSEAILEAVRKVLSEHADIGKLRIEGHTDDRGSNKTNRELSRRRAASVMRWLTQRAVDASRLSAWGCGEEYPLAANSDDDARQANRRVEFHIEGAADASEAPRTQCEEIKSKR
jgi:outer membrane protein OmpA-like peptidoglycan-associated protein